LDADSRRLELLKLEGLGFSQAEIVNELSQKSSCTKRAVYKDFETRESWQPILQSVVDYHADSAAQVFQQHSEIPSHHRVQRAGF
jgi:hypothetical protein